MSRETDNISFKQACFISGMSADTFDFLSSTLTNKQKEDFIKNERETVTNCIYYKAISNTLYPST